jgi:hypothetical protein
MPQKQYLIGFQKMELLLHNSLPNFYQQLGHRSLGVEPMLSPAGTLFHSSGALQTPPA